MCPNKLIIFIVQIWTYVIFYGITAGAMQIKIGQNSNQPQNYTTKEFENLILIYENRTIFGHRLITECRGSCKVNERNVELSCSVDHNPNDTLKININQKITAEHRGVWKCNFNLTSQQEGPTYIPFDSTFQLYVGSVKEKMNNETKLYFWVSIGLGVVSILAFLVIFTQCLYIIRLRKKCKNIHLDVQWSNKTENSGDVNSTVRYSKMPGAKIHEVLIPTARESGIYEALEFSQAVPEPPPVDSLPGRKAFHKSVDSLDSPAPSPKVKTNAFNSLLRRNKKKSEADTDSKTSTLDKRTTLDRIRERPPMPIPVQDELYEAMDESPMPARKEYNRPVAKENPTTEDFRGFPLPKPKPAPLPTNMGNVPLNTQLKQALEKKNRTNPRQPPPPPVKPQPPTKDPTPTNQPIRSLENRPHQSPVPSAKVWPKKPVAKVWPREPPGAEEGKKTWGREQADEMKRTWGRDQPPIEDPKRGWQREQSEVPRHEEPRSARPRPKPTPFNPGLPPPDAAPAKIRTPWGEALPPKPRAPKPINERPHYPPPPSNCTPEPEPEHDPRHDDSDDEWLYEPLPQYNIYSM